MRKIAVVLLLLTQIFSVFGIFRVVSVAPISSPWAVVKVLRDGEILWNEMVNARGGILVNGTRHLVEVISIDVGAPTEPEMRIKVVDAVKSAANGTYGEVHAMFAPFSSGLTQVYAIEAEKHKILSCGSGGSSPKIFECDNDLLEPCTAPQGRRFEYLVGVQASTEALFPPSISLARVKGAKSIGLFTMTGLNELYFKAAYNGAIEGAQDNNLQVVADIPVPYAANVTVAIQNMKLVIEQLKQAKPDLVVGSIFGCTSFVQAMKETNYTAPAILLAECVSDATFTGIAGEAGRYVSGPALWDRRLSGRIFREDGKSSLHFFPATTDKASPQIFYESFIKRFNYTPSYHAAFQFACGLAVQGAAEFSNSLETEAMRSMINTINTITFYGQLQFNTFGQIVETGLGATLQVNQETQDMIVLPIASAASDMVYPMPTFEERQEVISWYGTPAEQGIVIVAGVGILVCIVLMILFAAWRDRPQIIASSLLFVELIIVGAIMIYASLFFWVLETTTTMCNLRYWLAGVGFVLMFSALLTKTWRVWRIFHEHSLKMIKLTNYYLLRIMAVALGIEIVILAVWSAAFTPQVETVVVDEFRPILNYRTCVSSNTLPFAIVLIIYKAVLIIGGVVLGFWSRKIRSEYNESKFILIAMYNITFATLILLVLFAIQINDRYIDFLIRSIAILWGVTATLCILLIPKIYYVATGSNDPTRRKNSSTWTASSTPQASVNLPETYEEVEEQLSFIARREQTLRERLVELKASDRRVRSDSHKASAKTSKSSKTTGNSMNSFNSQNQGSAHVTSDKV
jgi:hypothetical protein